MSYDQIPVNAALRPEKFTLKVSDEQLEQFRQLLKWSSIGPQTYENTREDVEPYGLTYEWMSRTRQYWVERYDWRKREEYISSFPNFTVPIQDDDGTVHTIHFAALFSENPNAVPIAFLHGWPGSFLEFLGVLSVLKSKYSSKNLPFHVIVPSLPGYTLSSGPPLDKDFKVEDIARIVDKLMTGLGFGSGYMAQGGDIGSYTCRPLSTYPSCKAIHINFCMMDKPASAQDLKVSPREAQGLKQAELFASKQSAYALEHGTRPATIGFTLSSSPLAVLAWIGEKFLTWTDPATCPPIDDILDSITLYWFTHSFPRGIYPYREFHYSTTGENYMIHSDPQYHVKGPSEGKCGLGYSCYPKELAPMPTSWVATTGELVWSRTHDRGGHFAAMERPDAMVQDMEDFVHAVWKT